MTSCKFSSSLDTVCPLMPPLRFSSPSRAGSTLSERSSLTSRTISSSARRRLCITPRAGSETSAASRRGDAPAMTARPSVRIGRSVRQIARSQPSCRLHSLTSSIVSSPPSSPYSTSGRRVSRTVGISQETRSLMRSESTPGSSSANPSTNSLGTWGGASRPMTPVPSSESSPFGLLACDSSGISISFGKSELDERLTLFGILDALKLLGDEELSFVVYAKFEGCEHAGGEERRAKILVTDEEGEVLEESDEYPICIDGEEGSASIVTTFELDVPQSTEERLLWVE